MELQSTHTTHPAYSQGSLHPREEICLVNSCDMFSCRLFKLTSMKKVVFLLLPVALLFGGCGGGGSSGTTPPVNPTPTITSLSPSSLSAGSQAQTLTINGGNFISSSRVTFNGSGRAATFIGTAQLTIPLTTADLATAGVFPVAVISPTPGGGTSSVNFTVTAINPVPTITSLSPTFVTAGTASQTLTISGTGFIVSAQVMYNGLAHAATVSSSTQLTIQLLIRPVIYATSIGISRLTRHGENRFARFAGCGIERAAA